ncbi:MAG TPA: cytochrome c biogenesis protein ResB, partial [Micromonosporaceae bacterium]|nr:cytochrome c biogenesis protein ResB [Micromonosporaceae bacterium]
MADVTRVDSGPAADTRADEADGVSGAVGDVDRARAELETGGDWTVTQDRPAEQPPPGGGAGMRRLAGFARRSWRGLTTMRTALVLLFMLAVAAIPGSLLPQHNISPEAVTAYYRAHPGIAPLLDRLGLFGVFASPWFSAIYLLLFISLVGCLVPRLRTHVTALRRTPPDAPARLHRMPLHAENLPLDMPPAEAAERLRAVLRARRYRAVAREHAGGAWTVSAEKGYLKETGNLLFHFSLLALLIGVAFGSWFGWHADRLLVAGDDKQFCSVVSQFDDYGLGARMSAADIEPFCLTLDSFHATYLASGQPVAYTADVTYTEGATSTAGHPYALKVNDPLRLPKANVYLLGHGYAPILKYTDRYGHSSTGVFPFLGSDANETSSGAAVFPDVNVDPKTGSNTDPHTFVKQQVGFAGFYYPTVSSDPRVAASVFPAENDPMLVLVAYAGDLGLDSGVPQSVYSINQAQVESGRLKVLGDPHAPIRLRPGQTAKLADGTTVQFVGTRQWVTLTMRYDPGEKLVLAGAVALVVGLLLSLTGRRRRVWFRVLPEPSGDGRTVSVAAAGGLARAEYASFPAEFGAVVDAATDRGPGSGGET